MNCQAVVRGMPIFQPALQSAPLRKQISTIDNVHQCDCDLMYVTVDQLPIALKAWMSVLCVFIILVRLWSVCR
jgi:hypothetical protein